MFHFKQFSINQDITAMKVGTDGVLLGAWANLPEKGKFLDIGSGTGLISLIAAQKSKAEITAVEIERNAYKQTCENFRNSIWHNRLKAINTSFQDYYKTTQTEFDSIICNPPFFEKSLKNKNQEKTLARHNEHLPYNMLILGVNKLLKKNGSFNIILPVETGIKFINKAEKSLLFCNKITKVKPNISKPPKRILIEFGKIKSKLQKNTIAIEKEKRHDYTEEYIMLTKEFYLKM